MKTRLLLLLATSTLLACGSPRLSDPHKAGLAVGHPAPILYPTGEPGETRVLERPYKGAPPQIPHYIRGFTIDRTTNDCMDCHNKSEEVVPGHKPTQLPVSHFENPFTGERLRKGGALVTGMRHNCMQCHVQQAMVD